MFLAVLNDLAPQDRRSEMVSSYLIACCCGISLPVVGIGLLSKAASPWIADLTFGIVIAVAAIVAFVVEINVGQKSAPSSE